MRFTKYYHMFLHPHSLENPSKSAGFTVVFKKETNYFSIGIKLPK